MKMTTFKKYLMYVLLGSGSVLATSCDDDDSPLQPDDISKGAYQHGVFITNEGNFGTPNGEVSFYDRTTKAVTPTLFSTINNRALGDVVQSMTIANDKGYIVANNSNKVEVVDANTFVSTGVINGLEMPRYMAVHNQKAYVTEWVSYSVANGRVAVVDLNTNTVTKTIAVGSQPEAILVHNNKVYVANSNGNTVSVINPGTDVVERTITVKDGPNSMVVDASNNLWVLCGGKTVYDSNWAVDLTLSTRGTLVKINPATNAVVSELPFPSNVNRPGKLAINGAKDRLYYVYGGTYAMSTTATALPSTPLINRSFYGLGVDPQENIIYAGTGGYTSNGWVIRYQSTGAAIDSFQVRVLPNGFNFR